MRDEPHRFTLDAYSRRKQTYMDYPAELLETNHDNSFYRPVTLAGVISPKGNYTANSIAYTVTHKY